MTLPFLDPETPQKEVAKSLLQVLARSEHDLPPADFSSILTQLCRISEFIMTSL